MDNPTVAGLRSRSRSKTPFLRSSCDRENCGEGEDHTHHKSGRKTPIKRNTPVKQLRRNSSARASVEIIPEELEHVSPPAHRTRQSTRTATEKLIKTSDYSSEESPDRWRNSKEIAQNQQNYRYEYERVSTSSAQRAAGSLADLTLSPIHGYGNISADRSTRFGSPASVSACSTDSSFAEQALADASTLVERDPEHSPDHLPYRLYKMAGEYWNKYPKTDYTYSPLSKDRVELAPGQVAVPNMSRRSLSQFRLQGPNTSPDEVDLKMVMRTTSTLRKRYTNLDSSDDETSYRNGGYTVPSRRWSITTLLISIITTITTSVTNTASAIRNKVFGAPSRRYSSYSDRREEGLASRAASMAAAPFYWTYMIIKKVITTTVTTITETISPSATSNHVSSSYMRMEERKSRRWPWFLLLLLPILGYGCYRCEDIMESLPVYSSTVDEYVPPPNTGSTVDPNLMKRIAALEKWAMSVDSKFKMYDQKLTILDNIEATIETHSLKHLQQNIIQIFNLDSENSEILAGKLKSFFDEHYVTKEQMASMSASMYERLRESNQSQQDEQKILAIVQEYLAMYEQRQKEVIIEKVKEIVKEVRVERVVEGGVDEEAIKKIVARMLNIYDADKTGMVDYALESAGGQVLSTKCTELYQIKTKQYFVLGLPVWWVSTSPRLALSPGAVPADCWAFQGFPGYLVIRTYAIIEVTGFSMEHMSKLLAVEGKIESAPKNFSVYGLRDELDPEPHLFGDYMYDANGTSIQYFPVQYPKTENIGGVAYPVAYDIIELRVESNHGNPTYTCVYRFRVHGNPLSDIRRATEDSIRDSENY